MKQQTKPKHLRISLWHLMFLIGLLYLMLIWLGYRQLVRNASEKLNAGQVFRPKISQNGGLQLFVHECPAIHRQHYIGVSNNSGSVHVKTLKPGMCNVQPEPMKSVIQMENEWSSISVGYPQYVYTVSGWIQVIDVPTYDVKPLHVIIVPHSHQDPGWKDTVDGYFDSYTRKTLDNIVIQLGKNPTWKFVWAETSVLERWFDSGASNQDKLKSLINKGQLEIVTGGWVMTDEAVTHYSSMLDQLIEGHQWLHDNLGIVPNTSWSIDPFGHSPTMTYFLKKSGIDKMIIQRVHFGIKRHFANKQNLEFMWRQAWDADGSTGILCHMMPFLLYAIHYSCGPDPHVCCQFDFHADKCFRGKDTVPRITVEDTNIKKLAWALWEQFQKKSQLYRSNILLVPHGDDFRYSSESEWSEQFGNLGKLMEYMNKDRDMNIKVEFGTVSDYFKAVEKDGKTSKLSFPSLTGDFFPYNDRDDQYWTGFYSVRPLLKHMARILQAKQRITEIVFSLTFAQPAKPAREFYANYAATLVDARRALGLFQHHDAITGTSKKNVMIDYGQRLQRIIERVDSLLTTLMVNTMTAKLKKYKDPPPNTVFMTEGWNSATSPPVLTISHFDKKQYVIVINPLTVRWKFPVTIRTSTPAVVRTKLGSPVPSQINPVFGTYMQPLLGVYDVVFLVELPALSMQMYQVIEDMSAAVFSTVTIFGKKLGAKQFIPEFKAQTTKKSTVEIENNLLKATFSSCTGTLHYLLRKTDNVVHQTSVKMVSYGTGSWINPFRDKSGAYIFMPDGHAQEQEPYYPSMVVVKGPVMSSVVTHLPGIVHSASLYNITGPLGAGIHLDNMVDLSSEEWENKEFAMRIVTDVISPDHSICADLNGYQMHKKKWRSKLLIQGNFHPMTSMAYIDDGQLSRMTLITAEAHGVASLFDGTMEVILDRRLMQDDWRGLNEGPRDNYPSPSKFILVPERRSSPGQTEGLSCHPSTLAHLLASHLNNPPQAAFLSPEHGVDYKFETIFLSAPWPCQYNLLNLRNMGAAHTEAKFKAMMMLHNVGLDCSYSETYMDCDMNKSVNLDSFTNLKIESAIETSLTGVKDISKLQTFVSELKDMEIKAIRVVFR